MQSSSTKKSKTQGVNVSVVQGEEVDIEWEENWQQKWDDFCDECKYKGQTPLVVFAKYIPLINENFEDEMHELVSRLTIEEIAQLTAKLTGKK